MWIVDNLLKQREEEGRPIRVGIVGAGFMSSGGREYDPKLRSRYASGRNLQQAA